MKHKVAFLLSDISALEDNGGTYIIGACEWVITSSLAQHAIRDEAAKCNERKKGGSLAGIDWLVSGGPEGSKCRLIF